jgi:protein-disulfide isomerase
MSESGRVFSIFLLAVAIVTTGCGGVTENTNAPAQSAPTGEGGEQIVAYLDGEAITQADLELEVMSQIKVQDNERYDMLKRGLETMISNRLFQQEADALGITLQELISVEVTSKVPEPSEIDVRNFFEEHKHEAPQIPEFEDVKERIARVIKRRAMRARRQEYLASLMAATGSQMLLQPPRTQIEIPEGTKIIGPVDAPITLIEFADYECPACKTAYPLVDFVLNKYKGQIRYAFIDYPLPIHANAVPASVAAHCADDQDLFWDYHQNLMLMVGDLSNADLLARAASVGLDVDTFSACLDSNKDADKIEANSAIGRQAGVGGTPTFFVNGRFMPGVTTTDEFKVVIDEELRR